MLVDGDIRGLIDEGILQDADINRIGPVSYDLRNYAFYRDGQQLEAVTLEPGGSTYVGAEESILLPNNLVAQVVLKNSRIRQGLAIAAPIYFPGHCTRVFYRVSNISADEITLDIGHEIAQVVFERLERVPDHPYEGAFSNEFDYRGLGSYKDVYGSETRKLERKAEVVEGMEQRIYGNVIAIMGVFVAVFSLINVDLSWMSSNGPVLSLVVLNLSIVGGMAALVGLISAVLGSRGSRTVPWIVAALSFAVAVMLMLLVK